MVGNDQKGNMGRAKMGCNYYKYKIGAVEIISNINSVSIGLAFII